MIDMHLKTLRIYALCAGFGAMCRTSAYGQGRHLHMARDDATIPPRPPPHEYQSMSDIVLPLFPDPSQRPLRELLPHTPMVSLSYSVIYLCLHAEATQKLWLLIGTFHPFRPSILRVLISGTQLLAMDGGQHSKPRRHLTPLGHPTPALPTYCSYLPHEQLSLAST